MPYLLEGGTHSSKYSIGGDKVMAVNMSAATGYTVACKQIHIGAFHARDKGTQMNQGREWGK